MQVLCRPEVLPRGVRPHLFKGAIMRSATQHHGMSVIPDSGPLRMFTDTRNLFKAGAVLMSEAWQCAAHHLGWGHGRLDFAFAHQVSFKSLHMLQAMTGLDDAGVPATLPEYGNCGPASLLTVWSKAWEEGKLQAGHRIGLVGFGGGMHCILGEVAW